MIRYANFSEQRGSNDDSWSVVPSCLADLPIGFEKNHCYPARMLLGWSLEALAFRSGVSPTAIRRIEAGQDLRCVTLQALAHTLEREGLVFFPGHAPLRGENCRGATPHPNARDDYHLLE